MDKNVAWTEHRNAEGRTYWFNPNTKESSWEKPEALKTPFEQALSRTQWKEYFSGGRKYYYNTESKESKWDMPDELLLLLEKVEKEAKNDPLNAQTTGAARSIAPNFTLGQGASSALGGTDTSHQVPSSLNGAPNPNALAVGAHTGVLPLSAASVLPARPNLPDDPVIPHNGFATVEDGEKAFTHLLRKAGVDANWTWDQTMRAIITDPLYKSLNTLAEKKRCWQKFVDNLKEKEREEREARLAKIRPAIRNMLKGNPSVYHYTTFETADTFFAQHPIWQQAKIESERRMIFEEYVAELKQREIQESRAVRARNVNKVVALFKTLGVDVLTRWRAAHTMIMDSKEWKSDNELQSLPPLDILLAFEDYSRVREREFEEKMRREQVEKTRRERKAREAFKELLHELLVAQKIKARSKWKDVYPSFQDDERYLSLLGNPGSNPIELFWDVVDSLDQKLDGKITIVEDAIRQFNKNVGPEETTEFNHAMTEATFQEMITLIRKGNDSLQELSDEDYKEVYNSMHTEAVKKLEAEKRRAERKQRHMQDDLRYALKKLTEPIEMNMSFEEAVPLMEHLPEFKALEDDGRRAAFTKFMKRQKERLREREPSEDGGSTTSRKRKEPAKDKDSDRDYHRDKDRDYDRERDRDHDKDKEEPRNSKHHRDRRGHDAEYEGRRDKDYRERDRDYKERDRERDREKDKEPYRSRYDRERDRDRGRARDQDDRRREGRRASRSETDRDWEDPRYAVVHEGGEKHIEREKRERERSVYSDRSEKRARYEGEEPARDAAPPAREETPEEGEI